ncbi:OmpA family protein [Labrys sp. ZIDIC5]|uniref:OmpA family protein n=1 Tax=Labrys sedimenti TaxID=3106036 RepID=UPI002ACA0305|nr:OmpA family protein [Labrys sp. ZIDIC5]MDZ5453212.1 OmpA family protein [Labrys sp. ZIDIC5]
MRRLGAAAALLVLALPAWPASALVIEHRREPIGEHPTLVRPRLIGVSRWQPYALPPTRFAPQAPASRLGPAGGASSLRLREVPAKLRSRTQALLEQFGARESEGKILISLPGDVLFDFDKADIRADAKPVLARLVEVLKAFPKAPVAIGGHTDAKGEDDYNLALSERRAVSVKAYLARSKISPGRLTIEGYGEARPVAPNQKADGADDPEGRQRNRRVEFEIGKPPE